MIMLNPNRPINWKHKLNKNLVCWWLGMPNYNKSNTWKDLCGRLHGTLNLLDPGPSWVGSQGGQGVYGALRFNGNTNRYVGLDKFKSSVLEVSSPGITIFTVLKLNSNQVSREILVKAGTGGAPTGFGFGIDDSTTNKIKWYTGNGSTGNNLVSRSALTSNYWYSVCVTSYNLGIKEIYINGEFDNSILANGYSISYGAAGGSLGAIGSYIAGGSQFINADIASLMFYNRPLSSNEIKLLHLSSKLGYLKQLNFVTPFRSTSNISTSIIVPGGYQRKEFRGIEKGIYRGVGRGIM